MSERIHVLAQQLFGKPTVAACTLQEIREVAERYPYFAPAQFLLLEKLKEEGDPSYSAQLQRSVLYYHNPVGFEYFINSDRFYTALNLEEATVEIPVQDEHLEKEESIQVPQEENSEPLANMDVPEPVILPEAIEAEIPETSETPAVSEISEVSETPEASVAEKEQNPGDTEKPLPGLKIVPTTEAAPLTFEPFHTVDYFASQGIKLSQEEAGKDKFGQQLKSFTEWLKTMKRLPHQAPPAPIDTSTEQNVQHMAADSVHEAEILTEAMAEVWLKQGNKAKAAEIYRKLSLLNPSKMAYFAAKIDQLKLS